MTEQEWLDCTSLEKMLEYLRDKVSVRKLRLFACAFCRDGLHLPSISECVRRAVETAEKYTDGLANARDLNQSHFSLLGHNHALGFQLPEKMEEALVTVAAMATTDPGQEGFHKRINPGAYNIRAAVTQAYLSKLLYCTDDGKYVYADESPNYRLDQEEAMQSNMLRDVIGPLPFRSVSMDPAWSSSRDGIVKRLARMIDQERRYEDMPKIADALEKAGCTNELILDHCKSKVVHVKGCWVLDFLLGKE